MPDKALKNKVFINEYDVIEIVVAGDQTADSITKLADETDVFVDKLRSEGKPVILLDNLFTMGKTPPEARKVFVERAKAMNYDKFAMVSNDRMIRFGANLLLQAIGKAGKVKYFDDYGDAIKWLTEKR